MKTLNTVFATSVLAMATSAANADIAAARTFVGTLDSMNVVGATADPTLTTTPAKPTFSQLGGQGQLGNFQFTFTGDGAARVYTGVKGVWDFDPYTTKVNAGTLGGTANITQNNAVYEIGNTGTVSYNAATRTLTLGQPLVYSTTDSGINNNQTSDASAKWGSAYGATNGVCSGSSTVCNGQSTHFLAKPDLERFYLSITFSADYKTFTGTAVSGDVGGPLPVGKTGNQWAKYSFSGEVPVPAAAWLFGSALVGLAGVARRKAA